MEGHPSMLVVPLAMQPLPGSQGLGGVGPSPRCHRWIQVQSTTVNT